MNKPFIFVCVCGTEFRKWKCRVSKGENYCSKECMYKDPKFKEKQSKTKQGEKNGMFGKKPPNFGSNMKATAFCENCGKTYFRKRCILAKTRFHYFCSRQCSSQYQSMYSSEYRHIGFTGNHTKETKLKIRLAKIGQKAWNKDMTGYMSKQARINIGNARKTPEARERVRKQRLHQVFPSKDSKPEIIMQKALKLNNIEFDKHVPIIGQPDVFIQPNHCVFVDGDYWHAHPQKYKPNDIITRGRTALDVWSKDNKITMELKSQGMKVYRFWESDIIKDVQLCVQQIEL